MKATDMQSTLPLFVENPSTERCQWRTVPLRDIIFHPDYGVTASATIDPVGSKFLRITDIGKPTIDWDRVPHCRCSDREKEEKRLRNGDLVVARIGATTGITYLYRSYDAPAVFASYLIRIRCSETLSPEFLNQFSQSPLYWNQVDAIKQGRLKEGINTEELKSLMIPLPPLPEQQRIATVLATVDEAIAAAEKIILSLIGLRQFLLLNAISLKNTQQYEKWSDIELSNIADISCGTTPPTQNKEYYRGTIPIIKTAEICNNIITDAKEHISNRAINDCKLKIYPPGTVLMAMYGQGKTRGQVGLLAIEATITQNAAAIIPRDDLDSIYLFNYLMVKYEELRSIGVIGHISHLNLNFVKKLRIPLPPLPEQRRIAAILSTVDDRLATERTERDRLITLKKGLMQVLLTGRVRVPPGVAEEVGPAHV